MTTVPQSYSSRDFRGFCYRPPRFQLGNTTATQILGQKTYRGSCDIAFQTDFHQNTGVSITLAGSRLSFDSISEILMTTATWHRVLCCAALLSLLEGISGCAESKNAVVPARPAVDAKIIPFPSLPPGAGEIGKDAPQQFTQTASGLRYRILRMGNGAMPLGTDTVKVNYHGWLDDGKVFDSSYERNKPISFPLSGVIAGWTEGMQYVREGGMIELEVPASQGYGDRGVTGSIPGGATLHFLVELLKIE